MACTIAGSPTKRASFCGNIVESGPLGAQEQSHDIRGDNVTCTHNSTPCVAWVLIFGQKNWISVIDQLPQLADGYETIYLVREA